MDEQGMPDESWGNLEEKAQEKRPWYKKKRFLIPIGLVVVFSFAANLGGGESAPTDSDVAETVTESNETEADDSQESASDSSSTQEEIETDSFTTSQANAIESAESYLRFSSFSRSGLIDQLEFEGFSNADATYAVDKVDPDWFEQAAKSAKSYLDFSSFSRQGLIDQLEFEGFTTEEAIYGVEQNGF